MRFSSFGSVSSAEGSHWAHTYTDAQLQGQIGRAGAATQSANQGTAARTSGA
eukprot:COSAG02_NODE_1910_length_10418_cov_44.653552_9_plen_52_part_00